MDYNGSTWDTNMAITNAGLVGIGTTVPTAQLHIYHASNTLLKVANSLTDSLFEVTQASMSANIPASFNAAGDTEIAYNLNFSNDTASYIRSLSPLYIEAGDQNSAEDLTLRSRGTGDVVIGNSTSYFYNDGGFEVKDGSTSRLFVDAPNGTVAMTGTLLSMVGSNGYTSFQLADGGSGDQGTLRLFSAGTNNVNLTADASQPSWISSANVGIGITAPTVKLHVNGDLRVGNNHFWSSAGAQLELNTYGSGNRHSFIDFHGDDTYTDYGLRVIRMNTGANTNSIIDHRGTGNLILQTADAGADIQLNISGAGSSLYANGLKSGAGTYNVRFNTSTNEITYTTSSIRFKTDITPLEISSDNIYKLIPRSFRFKNETIRAHGYIAEEALSAMPELVIYGPDGLVEGFAYDTLNILMLEELKKHKLALDSVTLSNNGELAIDGEQGEYTVENTQTGNIITNSAAYANLVIAKIQSGIIQTKELVVETLAVFNGNVEIRGTLNAQSITSPTIQNLEVNHSQLTAKVNNLQSNIENVLTQDLGTGKYYMSVEALSAVNLNIIDSANLASIAINGSTITTQLNELRFSAMEKAVFFDNQVTIAKDGTITAKGEIIAEKGIRTNSIKGLNQGDDVAVKIADSRFKIQDETEKDLVSINASDSAYFAQGVTFDKNIASASAVIAAEQTFSEIGENTSSILTNGEASGQAVLPLGQQELLIRNSKVKEKSLIYISPEGTTSGQLLYLDSKKENEWFKVKLDSPAGADIKFNWWIL